ncbi:MAG TPA: OmpA family protein, partial [Bryobacteraceae bacterium]|nr:OmpA family protein [Bryobacteraceae bacterium]
CPDRMARERSGRHNSERGTYLVNKTFYLNIAAVTALSVFGAACAKKSVAVNTPPAPPPSMASTPSPARTQPAPSRQAASRPVTQNASSRFPDAKTRARIDELLSHIEDAYFDYNRHTLRDDAVTALNSDSKELAVIMNQYPEYKLQVQGYCDERGSAEYNIALGEARAKSAKDYLVSVGVSGNQLSTISYGKEKQICDEHDEACWAKNRRVHIMAFPNQG